jgi:tRNA A-37 threonylcarbamoyl transferase component Bud32
VEGITVALGADPLAPGVRIGPYLLGGRLGEGGMGVVLKAEHAVLMRAVALKVMRPEIAADRACLDRFLREARAAAAVNHQNLVAIHDAGEIDGRTFLAFEFVPGGDLDAALARDGALAPARALELIAGCADGLQALHEAGLVHRDIKPHNIFLDARGRPKLGDFGLARDAGGADRLTMTGVGMGTPAYMAPEQANGDPGIDIRADIHALGGTLYTLLTRRIPFTGATPWAVVNAVVNDPVPDPRAVRPDLPAEVAAIVARAMAKRREERFQTPAELATACRAAHARLTGATGAVHAAPLAAPPEGGLLGPFGGSGLLWLGAVAGALLLLPLALNPLCALHAGWTGPGYGQTLLWGQWLGYSAWAALMLWLPLRLARGERVGRGGMLAGTALGAALLGALLWFAWIAVLDAAGAGRGWRPVAALSTSAAAIAWCAWWARAAWHADPALPGAQLTRLAQAAIPLLLATLFGHLIAAEPAAQNDTWGNRLVARHGDAEAAWALAIALPLALSVVAPLIRLRTVRR